MAIALNRISIPELQEYQDCFYYVFLVYFQPLSPMILTTDVI